MGKHLHLHLDLCAVLLLLLSAPVAWAQQEEAVTVFKRVKPSVVSLKNAEGSGTGIVLAADGTILTNAHVVVSPLPYTVQIEKPARGTLAAQTVTYKKVRLLGFHPKYDLAVLKIDPGENPGLTLVPVTLARQRAETGQRIYAIGDPAGNGEVLTKSLTSGLVSAVDREVDGLKYYQIDAAINPGNSGGPVCDKFGVVIGLVTFKFTDADAVGFAIPLDGLNVKEFVAARVHKGDPEEVARYLKLADKYADLGDKTGQQYGMDDERRMIMNYYAMLCYREALIQNPGEAGTYYNIGMLLRTLDEDEAGTAYLARAVQLLPWSETNADPYRELGFSLVKQKKDADALAAWTEGVAKYPFASKVWEDLTIYHEQHGEWKEAVYVASRGLLSASLDKSVRLDVLRGIREEAMGKLTAAEKTAAEARTAEAKLKSDLKAEVTASNKMRTSRTIYITPAFRVLMGKMGGAAVEDAAKTIPQKAEVAE